MSLKSIRPTFVIVIICLFASVKSVKASVFFGLFSKYSNVLQNYFPNESKEKIKSNIENNDNTMQIQESSYQISKLPNVLQTSHKISQPEAYSVRIEKTIQYKNTYFDKILSFFNAKIPEYVSSDLFGFSQNQSKQVSHKINENNHKSIVARFQTYNHTSYEFKRSGNGFTSNISIASTGISASYFKESESLLIKNKYDKKSSIIGDTKFFLSIPYFKDMKLFGGYSYQKSADDKLTKGPSYGFQADFAKYVSLDTTFIRNNEKGKKTTQVLLTFNMPLRNFSF